MPGMFSALAALLAGAITAGQPAPPFDLPSDHGGNVRLTDYSGRKVVLAFFPKAFTPG